MTVAPSRYNFAGSYEERAPDNYVTATYMFEVLLSDVGPTNMNPIGKSDKELQFGHMTERLVTTVIRLALLRIVIVVRFDLVNLDHTMWGSDVREILVQYFAVCDRVVDEMIHRRQESMGSASGGDPKLVTSMVRLPVSHGRCHTATRYL